MKYKKSVKQTSEISNWVKKLQNYSRACARGGDFFFVITMNNFAKEISLSWFETYLET